MAATQRLGAVPGGAHAQLRAAAAAWPAVVLRVWDADGREYTDTFAGIAVSSLGHAHPAVVEAVSREAATLAHTRTCSSTRGRSRSRSGCSACA